MATNTNISKPLKEWKTDYITATTRLSEITRNLAFAGIGIIWIFKNPDSTNGIFPEALFQSLRFLIFSLASDFLQYLWKAVNDYILYRKIERKYDRKEINDQGIEDVKILDFVPIGTWILFFTKITFMVWAYIKIYIFIQTKM